jgi:DNA polymerase-3 subunit delta'
MNIYPWLAPLYASLLSMRATLPHALLLTGPAGVGLEELADRFAAALLCEAPRPDGDACGTCPACGWSAQRTHPDLRRLTTGADADAEGAEPKPKEKESRWIRIDQVRALSEFLAVGGHRGGRKVVVIDPADSLNLPAANALLKTLEEPLGATVFLLVASRADSLLPTIRSRCVLVQAPLPAAADAVRWLVEAGGVDAAAAPGLLAAAGGAPLRAQALAEPAQATAYRAIVKNVAEIPDISSIQAAEAVASLPFGAWVPLLQAWVTDLGRVAAGAAPRRFPEQRDRLARLARSTTLDRIGRYGQWLQRQSAVFDHPLNPRLFCEDTLLRYRQLFG